MKKNKSLFSAISLILSLAFFVFSLSFTMAWFTDSKSSSGSATYGKVELGSGTTATAAADVTSAIPGDVLITGPFKAVKEANSVPIYIRAKITLAAAGTPTENQTAFINTVNTAINDALTPYAPASGYKWTQSGDWWYLANYSTPANALSVSDATEYTFINGNVKIPDGVAQPANKAQYGAKMTVNITFQAIQSENLGQTTVAGIAGLTWTPQT